jgi:lipopolysaccharide transport system ATP-binding protein
MQFTNVSLLDASGKPTPVGQMGRDLTFVLDFERSPITARDAVVSVTISDPYSRNLFMCLSRSSSPETLRLPLHGQVQCTIPKLPLLPGTYKVSITCKLGEILQDAVTDAAELNVVEGDFFGTGKIQPDNGGYLVVPHQWNVTEFSR